RGRGRGPRLTGTASVTAGGWAFALEVLREQTPEPASCDRPVEVAGGRIRDLARRTAAGAEPWATASEVLAHECGHTWQARRLSSLYWPVGAAATLVREGPRWYDHFEDPASEQARSGGIVNGSVCAALMDRLRSRGLAQTDEDG